MNQRGAKGKGKRWEDEVARRVGQWYYDDPRALDRTKGSRSRVAFQDQIGDIGVAMQGLELPWVLSIECKAQEKWDIESLLDRRKANPVLKFWKQCTLDARKGKKLPWLVLKKNYAAPLLITRARYVAAIRELDSVFRLVLLPRGLAVVRLKAVLEVTSPRQWIQLRRAT